MLVTFFPELRIRILIGSGFSQVSGSGSVFGIRIQEGKNETKVEKIKKSHVLNSFFHFLVIETRGSGLEPDLYQIRIRNPAFFISFRFLSCPLFCKELKRGGGEDGGQPGGHGRPPWRGPGSRREGGRLHQVPYIRKHARTSTHHMMSMTRYQCYGTGTVGTVTFCLLEPEPEL